MPIAAGRSLRRELGQHQSERGRQQQRAAGRLDDARGDERLDARRERARQRGEREDASPVRKPRFGRTRRPTGPPGTSSAANTIAYALRTQDSAADAAVEVLRDLRERDVDDEQVEAGHEAGDARRR